jgi:hypothetical protein
MTAFKKPNKTQHNCFKVVIHAFLGFLLGPVFYCQPCGYANAAKILLSLMTSQHTGKGFVHWCIFSPKKGGK